MWWHERGRPASRPRTRPVNASGSARQISSRNPCRSSARARCSKCWSRMPSSGALGTRRAPGASGPAERPAGGPGDDGAHDRGRRDRALLVREEPEGAIYFFADLNAPAVSRLSMLIARLPSACRGVSARSGARAAGRRARPGGSPRGGTRASGSRRSRTRCSALPEHEPREADLAAGADDEVRVGHVGRVEVARDLRLAEQGR